MIKTPGAVRFQREALNLPSMPRGIDIWLVRFRFKDCLELISLELISIPPSVYSIYEKWL
jgi:hypothetical protein